MVGVDGDGLLEIVLGHIVLVLLTVQNSNGHCMRACVCVHVFDANIICIATYILRARKLNTICFFLLSANQDIQRREESYTCAHLYTIYR